MRYRLRTLLILLAVLPPLLWVGWGKYEAWRAQQARQRAIEEANLAAKRVLLVTGSDLEPFIDQARLIELSSPPKTPMRPQLIDLEKLTRPKAPAKPGE